MKISVTEFMKHILVDRYFLSMLVAILLAGIGYSIYVAVSLHPSEVQVVTQYTAFGPAHFYREKWFYLIGFALFGFLHAALYVLIASRIFAHKGRDLAIPFLWLGLVMIVIATATIHQVLKVAALS